MGPQLQANALAVPGHDIEISLHDIQIQDERRRIQQVSGIGPADQGTVPIAMV